MAAKKLRQLRQQAFERQNRCCFYCEYPIWDTDQESFSRAHGLPSRISKHLQCTAEHLVARQDSGQDTADNIVAACLWCNRMRHHARSRKAPDPSAYKLRISQLIAVGRWHPLAASQRTKCLPLPKLTPHAFPCKPSLMARLIPGIRQGPYSQLTYKDF